MYSNKLIDPAILNKYNGNGPRYTSYPTALSFNESFENDDLIKAVKTSPNHDLSLYIHIPFCHSLCYYCACNKVVTRHQSKADVYVEHLILEITSRYKDFKHYTVQQIHFGGGTPNFLTELQMSRLMQGIRNHFNLSNHVEVSIEIDPRKMALSYLDTLANLGFNRLSIGVQDIDNKVQQSINRVQSTEFIGAIMTRAKEVGFVSINLDLIYGLPHQSVETFNHTLDAVIALSPERISLFSYAHLPDRFAAQRRIATSWLPDPQKKLELMLTAIQRLNQAQYKMIGMDHFAKLDDDLTLAQQSRTLHRNFQGYTTHGDCDLLGLGVSSISKIDECFSQNHKDLKDYYGAIQARRHAVSRGYKLSNDDQIRSAVIADLMCNLYVDKADIEQRFDIEFDRYFEQAITALKPFIEDALVINTQTSIEAKESARLIIRQVCMVFDAYLPQQDSQRYSRVI